VSGAVSDPLRFQGSEIIGATNEIGDAVDGVVAAVKLAEAARSTARVVQHYTHAAILSSIYLQSACGANARAQPATPTTGDIHNHPAAVVIGQFQRPSRIRDGLSLPKQAAQKVGRQIASRGAAVLASHGLLA
jgi:hypothetical protein